MKDYYLYMLFYLKVGLVLILKIKWMFNKILNLFFEILKKKIICIIKKIILQFF